MNFLTYKEHRRFYLSLQSDRGSWRQLQNFEQAKQNKFATIQLFISSKGDKTLDSNFGIHLVGEFVFESQKDLEDQLHRDTFVLNSINYFNRQEFPGVKWYLIGVQQGEVSLESFQLAGKTIVNFLSKDSVFTSSFKVQVYNKNQDSFNDSVRQTMDRSAEELQQLIQIRERIKRKAHESQKEDKSTNNSLY